MVVRIGEFQAAVGQGDALHQFLQSLTGYITGSSGCLAYEVLRKQDDSDAFVVIERWDSEAAHRGSVQGFPKEEMQAAMSLLAVPPTGAYYHQE